MTTEEMISFAEEQINIFPEDCKMGGYLRNTLEILSALPKIKEAYNEGYKDGQEALAFHLELCREEQESCDKCEVGNPCLYCKHEFEPGKVLSRWKVRNKI